MKMHLPVAALALGLLATSAAPAQAFTPGGLFFLNGPVMVTKGGASLPCTAKFTVSAPTPGSPDSDIVAADFSGTSPGLCTLLTGVGLPWHIHYAGSGLVQISGVALTHPILGNCGPAALNGGWSTGAFGSLIVSGGVLINCATSWNLVSSTFQSLP